MPNPETLLEDRFRRLVRRRLGGRVYKIAPIDAGMPDRLVLLPGGRKELVELKTDTGEVRPDQRVWHRKAAAVGTRVIVLSGTAEVEAWVEEEARRG